MPANSQAIRRKLMEELREAQRQFRQTSKRSDDIVEEVPSGLPDPDGTFRVTRVGKESQRALELYSRAIRRYSDFILHNITPDDL
jgi:hypothetical protein